MNQHLPTGASFLQYKGASRLQPTSAYRPYFYLYPSGGDYLGGVGTGGEPEQCKVCGDYASGVHFGVLTCEGCKGFFKRNHKESSGGGKDEAKPQLTCNRDQKCEITTTTRNSCRCCRYQKCLQAGMSRDAIKLGRRSKNEKVILNKDCEKTSCRNSMMTFINQPSFGQFGQSPFDKQHHPGLDIKSFGTNWDLKAAFNQHQQNVAINHVSPPLTYFPTAVHSPSPQKNMTYPDYSQSQRVSDSTTGGFYVPTQPTGGIYSGMSALDAMGSLEFYPPPQLETRPPPPPGTSRSEQAQEGESQSAASTLLEAATRQSYQHNPQPQFSSQSITSDSSFYNNAALCANNWNFSESAGPFYS